MVALGFGDHYQCDIMRNVDCDPPIQPFQHVLLVCNFGITSIPVCHNYCEITNVAYLSLWDKYCEITIVG